MKWRTKISVHKDGELHLRGEKLTDLIAKATFPQAVFLALRGRMPDAPEERMLNAVLVSMIEHGVEVPSAFVPRVSASVGNPANAALAAGMLAIGDFHGGAIEAAMRMLAREGTSAEIVRNALEKKERLPGYGHKIYKDEDPRVAALFRVARECGFAMTMPDRAKEIERELAAASGKTLPLNVDGGVAAVLLGLGFDPRLGKAFFAFARTPGMMAHIDEELANEKPYRRFEEEDVAYEGPAIK